jgi:paraquat-inducible protein B
MSERESDRSTPADVAEAVVETRSGPSLIWLIPLVAVLVGGFVAWRAIYERGPAIAIRFADAEGLEAGKTKIKYKDRSRSPWSSSRSRPGAATRTWPPTARPSAW